MKLKFLVLLAVVCFSAQTYARSLDPVAEPQPPAPQPGPAPVVNPLPPVVAPKKPKEAKPKEPKAKEPAQKKTHKEVRYHTEKRKVVVEEDCHTLTLSNRESCERKSVKGYTTVFKVETKEDKCDWTCDYEAIKVEEPVTEAPKPPVVEKHEKHLVKKKVKKAKKNKNQKECEGEKKIVFQNCLVKVRGLIAWGEKTKNFDKKFNKFLKKSDKRLKKKQPKPENDEKEPAHKEHSDKKPAHEEHHSERKTTCTESIEVQK